jgi:hypothetical protein
MTYEGVQEKWRLKNNLHFFVQRRILGDSRRETSAIGKNFFWLKLFFRLVKEDFGPSRANLSRNFSVRVLFFPILSSRTRVQFLFVANATEQSLPKI